MMIGMLVILVVFVLGTYWWMNRKPAHVEELSREDALILLRKVYGGINTSIEWKGFVSVPLTQDGKLEDIRKKCASIDAHAAYSQDLREGFQFNQDGLMEIKKLITQLESFIKTEGRPKSQFQTNCAQILEHKLKHLGMEFAQWEYKDAAEESFYRGELKGIEVFIYEDGASIKSRQASYMFDNQEYKTESELIRALVLRFTELAAQPSVR